MRKPPALDLSREQLERILDLHPDPFALVRHRDDVVVRCNVAYARSFDLSPEEVVGQRDSALLESVDREALRERLGRLERDGAYSLVERQIRKPDGRVRWVAASVALTEIDGELYRIGFGHDITERKRVEEALRISEEKYAAAFAAIPDGVALLGGQPEIRVLECNENLGRITGHDPREAVGKTVEELGLGGHAEDRESILKELAVTGKYTNHELWIEAKDGSERALLLSGRRLEIQGEDCFLVIAHDITEHKHLVDDRARLMRELQATLDSIETLRGVVPICAGCKKIRNDSGYWEQLEVYISDHSLAEFTHGLCPNCEHQALEELDQ